MNRAFDDLLDVQAEVADRPPDGQEPAVVGVGEEDEADDGQDEPGRAAGRLEDEDHQDHAGDDVHRQQRALAVEEALVAAEAEVVQRDRQDRVEPDEHRQTGEHPVEDPGVVRGGTAPDGVGAGVDVGGPLPSPAHAVGEEDERQGHREEDHEVVLAALLDGVEDLLEHEERDEEAPGPHQELEARREVARGLLLVVVGDDVVDVDGLGGELLLTGDAVRWHAG